MGGGDRTTFRQAGVVEHLPYPKRPKTLREILTMQETLTLFGATQSVNNKAILATAYRAGLRISAVRALDRTDIERFEDDYNRL